MRAQVKKKTHVLSKLLKTSGSSPPWVLVLHLPTSILRVVSIYEARVSETTVVATQVVVQAQVRDHSVNQRRPPSRLRNLSHTFPYHAFRFQRHGASAKPAAGSLEV